MIGGGMSHKGMFRRKAQDTGLPFIFSVTVGAGQNFQLPTISSGTYDAVIDWGDGDSDVLTVWNAAERTHTFSLSGTYDISISGIFNGWSVNNYADRLKITEVKQWGILLLGTGIAAFFGASNMIISATDILDTSQCTSFANAFRSTTFVTAPNIGLWDVSSITSLNFAFLGSKFDDDINTWNTVNLTSLNAAFYSCEFNSDLEGWDVSNVTDFNRAFMLNQFFNKPLNSWDVSSGTNFNQMFRQSVFNQNLNSWDVSSGIDFSLMFFSTSFNGSVQDWDVSSGTNFLSMFGSNSFFDQDLFWTFKNSGSINCSGMFQNSPNFNGDITGWNTSRFTDVSGMFSNTTSFNQDISSWDMSNVTLFSNSSGSGVERGMFFRATSFNQPIGVWNTSSGILWRDMFGGATAFDQDISNWNVESATVLTDFFRSGAGLSTANYDALLIAWAAQSVNSGLSFNGGTSQYTAGGAAEAARNTLINTYGWTIADGGPA